MRLINFIMGLIMICVGAYALYLTVLEQRRSNRPTHALRIARATVGLIALTLGVYTLLLVTNVIPQAPRPS